MEEIAKSEISAAFGGAEPKGSPASWSFVGAEAREVREAQGLKQREVADRIGVSSALYSHYERKSAVPSMMRAAEVASALGVTILEVGGFDLDATDEEMDAFERAVLDGSYDPSR